MLVIVEVNNGTFQKFEYLHRLDKADNSDRKRVHLFSVKVL